MRRRPLPVLLVLLGVGSIVALALRRSLVEVRGPSMEPTLWPGDRLVTLPAVNAWLRPGQVVVLDDPEDASHRIIKRVVTVRGGRVEVRGDDPRRSTDGRRWGAVAAGSIRRIAITRWPQVRSPLARDPEALR
jgi:nickel-type superoxide dismutase maturation protease